MNELALFAGAGGGILGSHLLGWRTVCAVERNAYAREVLLRRQEEGHLQAFPIWDDATTFDGHAWRGLVDVVSAGFPCQPFSSAGKRRGAADNRNLWPQTIRIIREVAPSYLLLENVEALLRYDYFRTILGEIAEAGFDAVWHIVSAENARAPHLRKRLWIMAYPNKMRRKTGDDLWQGERLTSLCGTEATLDNTFSERRFAGRADYGRHERIKPSPAGEDVSNADSQQQSRSGNVERADEGGKKAGQLGFGSEDVSNPHLHRQTFLEESHGQASHQRSIQQWHDPDGLHHPLSDTNSDRRSEVEQPNRRGTPGPGKQRPSLQRSREWWKAEPKLGRVANGVAYRVDRLEATGNGQVPAVVRLAWNRIFGNQQS